MRVTLTTAFAFLALTTTSFAGDNRAVGLSQSGAQSSVNISGGKSYRQTGTAIAPGLAVGAYSCQGSVSGGAGGAGWGFSFGSTVMDRDCNTRENAKVAQAFGMDVARRVLCNIEQIRAAAPQCQVSRRTTVGASPRRVAASNGWGQRN